ncbi:MAG: flagellar biosynthesis protein FlhF [Epsilonproteobacteria bacterium]|nr:flagellar biosynthesis protein FlhF [Campylobacterota bacterium]
MALKTFTGETMKDVMAQVKAEFGDDALIVSNKVIKQGTLTSPGLYEVVVQVDQPQPTPKANPRTSSSPKSQQTKHQEKSEDDIVLDISNLARKINSISNNSFDTYQKSTSSSSTTSTSSGFNSSIVDIKELQKEIQEVANTVKLLQHSIWDMNNCDRDKLVIPPEFSEIYAISKNSGMSKAHLDEIMMLTLKHMPIKMRKSPVTIRRYFNTLLRRLIPIRHEKELPSSTKKIMMFVGPTGVGKTTTIAKLAARYAYQMQRKYKVGIMTLDTYRIGAVEQLMRYAQMMKLSIETVVDPSDFVEALNRLRHNDIILIDTVGSSQHDKEKVDKINSFLSIDTFATIDVNLVMSATTKYEDLKDIYEKFSILNIDTLVITKLDETTKIGNVFSLIYDVKKPLNYFSIGQEVPDDLMVASQEYLIDTMLKDIK